MTASRGSVCRRPGPLRSRRSCEGLDLLAKVARRPMIRRPRSLRWFKRRAGVERAHILCERTARMEGASGWKVGEVGDGTRQGGKGAVVLVLLRHGPE